MGEYSRCLGEGFVVVTQDGCEKCKGCGRQDAETKCPACSGSGKDASTEKEWHLSTGKGRIKGAYETWLESVQLQGAVDKKKFLPHEDYIALLAKVSEKIALHKFSWGEPAWLESLQTTDGLAKIFQLLLADAHPEVRGWDKAKVDALMAKNPDAFHSVLNFVIAGYDGPPKEEPAPSPAPETTTAPA